MRILGPSMPGTPGDAMVLVRWDQCDYPGRPGPTLCEAWGILFCRIDNFAGYIVVWLFFETAKIRALRVKLLPESTRRG